MSINGTSFTDTLFYPFHLCHEQTVRCLLARFHRLHFRDYMAIQLSPFSGTTAYADRMGGAFQELVTAGRLIQGHNVSGPLNDVTQISIDRDLADIQWRHLFHKAIRDDRRFQRGLFDPTHAMTIGQDVLPGPAALLRLMDKQFFHQAFTVKTVQQLSCARLNGDEAFRFEYGLALLKTAAAQYYTIQLAHRHHLTASTDSAAHFHLLSRSLDRENHRIPNLLVIRAGY